MCRQFAHLALAVLGVGLSITSASADPLVYSTFDTRANGTYAVVPFSNDGDGSIQLTTTSMVSNDSQAKAGALFARSDGQALGTIGNLSSLTFDYYVDGQSTTPANSAPAVRLILSNTSLQPALVWERAYQTNPATPPDTWQDDIEVLGTNLLWQRANNQNFDNGSNLKPLSDWVAGHTPPGGATLNAGTPVYGIQISFGSGIDGKFVGYIDDVKVNFGSGASYVGNVVAPTETAPVPEPVTLATFGGLLAAGSVGYLRRKRSQAV